MGTPRATTEPSYNSSPTRSVRPLSNPERRYPFTNPPAAADYRTLRPKRQELGLVEVNAAVGLGVSTAKISLAARGHVHDAAFLTAYETWPNSAA
jgi:hypothetical protein